MLGAEMEKVEPGVFASAIKAWTSLRGLIRPRSAPAATVQSPRRPPLPSFARTPARQAANLHAS